MISSGLKTRLSVTGPCETGRNATSTAAMLVASSNCRSTVTVGDATVSLRPLGPAFNKGRHMARHKGVLIVTESLMASCIKLGPHTVHEQRPATSNVGRIEGGTTISTSAGMGTLAATRCNEAAAPTVFRTSRTDCRSSWPGVQRNLLPFRSVGCVGSSSPWASGCRGISDFPAATSVGSTVAATLLVLVFGSLLGSTDSVSAFASRLAVFWESLSLPRSEAGPVVCSLASSGLGAFNVALPVMNSSRTFLSGPRACQASRPSKAAIAPIANGTRQPPPLRCPAKYSGTSCANCGRSRSKPWALIDPPPEVTIGAWTCERCAADSPLP